MGLLCTLELAEEILLRDGRMDVCHSDPKMSLNHEECRSTGGRARGSSDRIDGRAAQTILTYFSSLLSSPSPSLHRFCCCNASVCGTLSIPNWDAQKTWKGFMHNTRKLFIFEIPFRVFSRSHSLVELLKLFCKKSQSHQIHVFLKIHRTSGHNFEACSLSCSGRNI